MSAIRQRRPARGRRDFAHRKDRGFTLFEMLLVLTVVALIAGISWPNLTGRLQENAVRSAAEEARRVADTARYKSVEEGLIYQFRYEPYGQRFLLMPAEVVEDPQANLQRSTSFEQQKKTTGLVYEIPKGLTFQPPPVKLGDHLPTERLPVETLGQLPNGTALRDVSWSTPILFYPDGSATDDLFYIQDQKFRTITVSVRGLTGSVAVSKIEVIPGGVNAR